MLTIGMIPAAGAASRLGGIPKFLLPMHENYLSLLALHVELMSETCSQIVIPTKPQWVGLVQELVGRRAEVIGIETSTMSETVKRTLWGADLMSSNSWVLLGMPDTFFGKGINPYKELAERAIATGEETIAVAGVHQTEAHQVGQVGSVEVNQHGEITRHADKDATRNFGQHWGTLAFRLSAVKHIDEQTPHVGYLIGALLAEKSRVEAVTFDADYFDCGTFDGYRSALRAASD